MSDGHSFEDLLGHDSSALRGQYDVGAQISSVDNASGGMPPHSLEDVGDDDDNDDDGLLGPEFDVLPSYQADYNSSKTMRASDYDRLEYSGISAIDSYLALEHQEAQAKRTKRERSNAKAVECLDLEGNIIETFRSGMAAASKMNIPQGDISLCCRGVKFSVSGYRFRFQGDADNYITSTRMRRSAPGDFFDGIGNDRAELTRTTRASRTDYASSKQERRKSSILAPADIKARRWSLEVVKTGHLSIKKWVPATKDPTPRLQVMLGQQVDKKAKQSKRKSFGSRM